MMSNIQVGVPASVTLTNDGVGVEVEVLEELLETPETTDAALETALGTVILRVLQPVTRDMLY